MKAHTNITVTVTVRQWMSLADKRLIVLEEIIKHRNRNSVLADMATEEKDYLEAMYEKVQNIATYSDTLTIPVDDLDTLISESI